jgi:lysozyme family protein
MSNTPVFSARFVKSIELVLQHEGGYVNDPLDAGGETNFGISKRAYPNLDIRNLTVDQAKHIYFNDYWKPIRGDLIVTNELAYQLFDMAVNAGTGAAARLLQRIVGTTDDGVIGPVTLKAIDRYPSIGRLIGEYKFSRARHYALIVAKNHSQVRFLRGWINRIDTTPKFK